ncbi:GNAT family protein [Lapillicoccus sp.]|uniref:GNAT family N-acetyltransferase n=1 Tax=Lapillicoccus sp. TaxID=1909287 RepID=UPI0025F7ADEC|nr:GNAT family protein [Lapillicoccus sp.]
MAPPDPRPPTGKPLVGRVVRLDPVTLADADGLFRVLSDPLVYQQGFRMTEPLAHPDEAVRFVAAQLAARPGRTAYTVRLVGDSDLGPAGTVVGTSSLGEIDIENEHVHLGWTTYGSRWWGTTVNPEAKLLLLSHAFDDCGFGRVRIQTDIVNERSQAAIARLGGVREGVLRRMVRRADGSWRDTVVFSILVDEWPAVRTGLERRLRASPGGPPGPPPGSVSRR